MRGICWWGEQRVYDVVTCLDAATGEKMWAVTMNTADPKGRHPRQSRAESMPGGLLLTYANFAVDDQAGEPVLYGTFRLNFHRFHRFELDLRGHTQP